MIKRSAYIENNYRYKVSVIVPCYNVLAYLDKCLENLVQQTLQSIEIITINDASTDGTEVRLDEWQELYPEKIKVIHHQKNLGVASARNTGLAIAKGESIGFVDSDDYVDLSMYAKLYQALIDNNADIAECSYTQVQAITGRISNKRNKFNTIKAPESNLLELLKKGSYPWKCLYKTDFLISNNIKFNENLYLYEDIDFLYNVITKSTNLVSIKDKLYYYQLGRSEQLTNISSKDLYLVFQVFDYTEEKLSVACNEYELINNFFIHTKIVHLFYFCKKIQKQYKFDFFHKAAYHLFSNTKVSAIYKILLISRYRKPIDYLRVPVFVIIAHMYYLVNKFIIAKLKSVLS